MTVNRQESALLALAVLVAAATGACSAAPAASPKPTESPALTLPMVVDGSAFSRDVPAGIRRWSVYCIPENTTPFDLGAATYWREVEVTERGPDGPDGLWRQHRACPDGKILAAG